MAAPAEDLVATCVRSAWLFIHSPTHTYQVWGKHESEETLQYYDKTT